MDVPVCAGDVVIGDSRLLHSAHANQTDEWRTVLTIWYWPIYGELPDEVQALIANNMTERPEWVSWCEQTREITQHLLPVYSGEKEQVPWDNSPGEALR